MTGTDFSGANFRGAHISDLAYNGMSEIVRNIEEVSSMRSISQSPRIFQRLILVLRPLGPEFGNWVAMTRVSDAFFTNANLNNVVFRGVEVGFGDLPSPI